MTVDHSPIRAAEGRLPNPERTTRRSLPASLAMLALLMIGLGAPAQVAPPTPAPTFCTADACYSSRDQAEASLLNGSDYDGADALLEHMRTRHVSPTTLRLQFWLRDRPADETKQPSYFANYGPQGTSNGACTLGDDQAALPNWCADIGALVALGESRFQTAWSSSGCTIAGTAMTSDFDPDLDLISNNTVRGIADYSLRWYRTTANCAGGTTRSTTWSVAKKRPFYCRTGFRPITGPVTEATVLQGDVCEGMNDDVAYITAPIQQCGGCAGSPNPVYPTTGEKQRHESDFVFAGTTFTRHYRSLRQFRNNRSFAIGWSHTWSDRIIDGATASEPYDHIDEQGNFEAYTFVSSGRYRGQSTVDRVLERVNAGGIGWRLRMSDGEIREFDLSGFLIAVRHPDDPRNDVTIAWVDQSVSTVTDAQGRVLRFHYADHLLQRIVLPDGAEYFYGHDADRNLTSVLNPDWSMRFYHYNEAGLVGAPEQRHALTGITDEYSQRIGSFSYDARGRVTESRMLGTPNASTQVSYPNEDAATVQTASNGSDSYVIQPGIYRRILSMADSAGSRSFVYDTGGRLQSMTDARGTITRYEYSSAYRSATIEAFGTPEQRRTEIDRDPISGRIVEHRVFDAIGALQAKTVWAYNARHQPITLTRIDPATLASRAVSFTYCEPADVTAGRCPMVGLLTAVNGPRTDISDVTTYTYRMADEPTCAAAPTTCPYRKGDLWKTTNALGHTVEIAKADGAGRTTSVVDATGTMTDIEYNPRGWASARKMRGTNAGSESDDRIDRFWHYPFGAIKRVLQSDGMEATFAYDTAHRLTTVGDNRGNTIQYTLNGAGDRIGEQVLDQSGTIRRSLSRTYDTLGRLQTQLDAYGRTTAFEYDDEGLPTATTDPLLRRAENTFDALGRLKRSIENVGGIAAQTQVAYDALDRTTRVTDPKGLETVYTYNGFGDVVQLQSPDTGTATAGHDAAGNRIAGTDARGVSMATQYDALNRPVAVGYPGADEDVILEYDTPTADCAAGETFLTGRLARMSDGSGSTSYCWNRFGDLVRKVQRTGGQTLTLRWTVLANGRLTAMTYPDGTVVDYVRDSLGRTTGIGVTPVGGSRQTLLGSALYHPFGPVAQWTYGNTRVMTRTLNQNGQPGIVQDTTAGGLSVGYEFDEVGNLKTLRNGDQTDPPLRRYGYDALNRLTEGKDGSTNAVLQAYAYDATGNRTSRTLGSTTEASAYITTNHRLQGVAGIARGYDDSGNTTSIGGMAKAFEYNQAGRLSVVRTNGTQTASYLYNGSGERVRRIAGGQTTLTLYGDAGQWLGDYDATGQPLQQAIWFGDLPVGLLTGTGANQKLHYVQADALGTPRVVIDPARNVAIWRWSLDGEAFGDSAPDQDPDNDGIAFVLDMRFPGQRYDSASGFNYNYFRDYDPATGRYVQSDPIGLAGGVSTYGYVGGNPTVRIDSKGLEVELNLFSRYEGSPFIRVADSFVSPPGVYAVGSHGDRLHVYDQNARQLSPLELAEMIKKDEKFKGKKAVLLFGCETGRDSLSFAQQLAEILQMPVVAPSAYVFYPQKGRIYLGEKNRDNRYVQGTTGEWVTFCPGGCPWLLDTIRSWFD
jgi:RHS repeat-associated protein